MKKVDEILHKMEKPFAAVASKKTVDPTEVLHLMEKPFTTVARLVNHVTEKVGKGASSATVQKMLQHSPYFSTTARHTDGAAELAPQIETLVIVVGQEQLPALPPDEQLHQKMQLVLQKKLHAVSMNDFYTICWSEGAFYKQWLENDDKHDIVVGDWEIDEVNGFVGTWDQQTYSQRRVVTYVYDRAPGTLGYSLGKPAVLCTQTQYFRREHDNDRSVIALTVAMDGEVCSDAFLVHIRGVATRLVGKEENALQLDFGVFCQFTKQLLLAGQIRNITRNSTKDLLLVLFDKMIVACHATEGSEVPDFVMTGDDVDIGFKSGVNKHQDCDPFAWLRFCNPHSKREEGFLDGIDQTMEQIRRKLRLVTELKVNSLEPCSQADITKAQLEFKEMLEALERILNRDEASFEHEGGPAPAVTIRDVNSRFKKMKIKSSRWIPFRATGSIPAVIGRIRQKFVPKRYQLDRLLLSIRFYKT